MRQRRATRRRKLDLANTYTTAKHERDSCLMCLYFNEVTLMCQKYMCSCGTALIHERLCGPNRGGRVTMYDI